MDAIAAAKAALRRKARACRDALPEAFRMAAAAALRDTIAGLRLSGIVAAYWPIGSEIDPRPAMHALSAQGVRIALPVVVERGAPLSFREWRPGLALVAAGFGLSVPPPEAPALEPETLLVPLLAFDRQGRRLGYGGGYYDRTLADLRARKAVTAIGLAFAEQEVPQVPTAPGDERLDAIATPGGLRHRE